MSKEIKTKVYEFDELSDEAKEKAREWLRDCIQHDYWWESTYEDAEHVHLKITSFDLGRAQSIEGQFTESAEDTAKAIIKEHGKDCETFKTAEKFLADSEANENKRGPAPSDHIDDAAEELESEFLKSILEDYRIYLQSEYEYVNSDEQIDESIRANEYTFTESGKRFG